MIQARNEMDARDVELAQTVIVGNEEVSAGCCGTGHFDRIGGANPLVLSNRYKD